MFLVDRQSKIPMYEQIYQYVKAEIESGRMAPGTRLLSVRRFAQEYGLSKITVEQAYGQLAAEGYLRAHVRAPFEVLPIRTAEVFPQERPLSQGTMGDSPASRQVLAGADSLAEVTGRLARQCPYNFATGAMDPEGFDYTWWKRLLNGVLREPDRLLAYGDEKGEPDLRQTIAQYVREQRGVVATADQVIIAGGTQPLLQMVDSLLQRTYGGVVGLVTHPVTPVASLFPYVPDRVVKPWQPDLTQRDFPESVQSRLLYCTPSHVDARGGVLSIAERHELLAWAQREEAYILEDDYDSELRYYGRPIPAMQGLDAEDRVIYLGAVSKVLPPSIRISYMVLPKPLLATYERYRFAYRQTAGGLEQLVLARYMEGGDWARQIRRLRKHYQEKSRYMVSLLQREFGDMCMVTAPEGGVYVELVLRTARTGEVLVKAAKEQGCAVRYEGRRQVSSIHGGNAARLSGVTNPVFLLSFSAISTGTLPKAIAALGKAWKGA